MSDASHLAPVYAQWPLEVAGADGVHLVTRDGRRVLDLYGGHAVAALGYSHPRLLETLSRQARDLVFQSNAVPLAVRERAALRLSRFAGLGLDTVFFVNSGAEANENALKLALRITGRRKVVAVEGSFHGRTAAAGAVTWGALKKWYGFPQAPFDVEFLPRSNASSAPTPRPSSSSRCRAWPEPSTSARNSSARCAPAAAPPARNSSSTKYSAGWAARASHSPRTCTAWRPT
jgi:4-aminobutyrate aminotransferase-like enzyme